MTDPMKPGIALCAANEHHPPSIGRGIRGLYRLARGTDRQSAGALGETNSGRPGRSYCVVSAECGTDALALAARFAQRFVASNQRYLRPDETCCQLLTGNNGCDAVVLRAVG